MYDFFINYRAFDTSNVIDIHKYLMRKMFIRLLTSIVSTSNHTKCISLSSQKCIIQATLINLHPNEYCQELLYYPFAVKLDRCIGSCMIVGISESKTLTKHVSCECKCKFDSRKCDSNPKWNNHKC